MGVGRQWGWGVNGGGVSMVSERPCKGEYLEISVLIN